VNSGIQRREFLVSVGAAGVCTALPAAGSAYGPALKERAQKRGLLYGAAIHNDLLTSDPAFAAAYQRECAIAVPEGELKWNALRPSPTEFDFHAAEQLLAWTLGHDIRMRGHTLVWHQSIPKWFGRYTTTTNARSVLDTHISTVVGHFRGRIHSWDVINEVIEPHDGRADALRIHPWLELLGAGYLDMAFHAAHEADPDAILTWNENILEEESDYCEAKRVAMLQMLEGMRRRSTPINAIGIQSHLYGDHAPVAGPKFRRFLHEVSDLGVKIIVTELDIRDAGLPADPKIRDRMIADLYYTYLSTVLAHKSVIAVLTWGLSDKYTWLSTYAPRPDGLPVRPLPLDAMLAPTSAWEAIARALDEAPVR
jgi:endo-1,4-beta-xylanase